MTKSRFLILASLGAPILLAGGALWNQNHRIERMELVQTHDVFKGRIERVKLVETRDVFNGSQQLTTVRRWEWKGNEAQRIFDAMAIDKSVPCNGCLSPNANNRLTIKVYPQHGQTVEREIFLHSGQVFPYEGDCIRELTPQSLQYFHDLVSQIPPNAD